jgi:HipA-like protein
MRLLKLLWAKRRKADTKPVKAARFDLIYAPPGDAQVEVGTLSFDGVTWTFRYSDEYQRRPDLRPIEGFDDRSRVYSSTALFPFFSVRIPDTDRLDVKRKLEEDHIDDPQAVDMLRIFGRRVVSSPAFELIPAA